MKSNSKKHPEVEIQVSMLTNAVLRQGIMHRMAITGSGDTALTTQCHKHLKGDRLQGASTRSLIWSPLRVTQPYIANIILVTNDPSSWKYNHNPV